MDEPPDVEKVSLGALTGYFLRLGTFGFGGPIALTAAMQRDLVLGRRWVTVEEYKEGLALAQLAPGPLAAQLAIYLGWARRGFVGATPVGLAFVGPERDRDPRGHVQVIPGQNLDLFGAAPPADVVDHDAVPWPLEVVPLAQDLLL